LKFLIKYLLDKRTRDCFKYRTAMREDCLSAGCRYPVENRCSPSLKWHALFSLNPLSIYIDRAMLQPTERLTSRDVAYVRLAAASFDSESRSDRLARVLSTARESAPASVAELQSAAIPERPGISSTTARFRAALTSLISAVETSLRPRIARERSINPAPRPISGRMPHRTQPLDSVHRAAGSRRSEEPLRNASGRAERPFIPQPTRPCSPSLPIAPVNSSSPPASSSSPLPRNIVIL